MLKSELLAAIRQEIRRRDFDMFVDDPTSRAQGGKSVVIAGCQSCKKQIGTSNQCTGHLTADTLPALIDRLSEANS